MFGLEIGGHQLVVHVGGLLVALRAWQNRDSGVGMEYREIVERGLFGKFSQTWSLMGDI